MFPGLWSLAGGMGGKEGEGGKRIRGWWGNTYGIKEVDDGDKGGVEEGPDDVEFPLQGLDAYGCDFDDFDAAEEELALLIPISLIVFTKGEYYP